MKLTMILKSGICLMAGVLFLFISCKKDSTISNSPGNDSTAANMSATSVNTDIVYNDVFNVALDAGSDNNIDRVVAQELGGSVQSNSARGGVETNSPASGICASYTVSPADTTTFPKTITVNFGAGCTSGDGITRSGTITFIFSGRVRSPGTTVSATFTNYTVNSYGLQGTYSVTNTSTLNGIAYTTQVTGGQITYPDASWYKFSGHRSVTQTAGQSTPSDFSDDVYSITESHTCISSTNQTLQDSVTTPLVKAYVCKWVSSGILSFSYNSIGGNINFGDGTCDSLATITVGPISLPLIMH
jgi:hypothetical protein